MPVIAVAMVSSRLHHDRIPISSSSLLKMNMNGRMPVRMLYQNAVMPVLMMMLLWTLPRWGHLR